MKKLFLILFSLIYTFASIIKPIPQSIEYNIQKAKLGKALFFDPLLSSDGSISCSTCHNIYDSGADGLQFSVGVNAKMGNINSPTVFNSIFSISQFWDGRARDLKAQAIQPILNPIEMANTKENLLKSINNSQYKNKFITIYGSISLDNIADAIAEFEKSLITPNSKFDQYLRKEISLSKSEMRGYNLFNNYGCISCHNGVNIGGNMYQKSGIVKNFNHTILGRYNVTKRDRDKFRFKVPSLRNISKTAPYFHNGSIKTLSKAVSLMAEYQLGRKLSKKQIEDLVSFLKTLDAPILKSVDEL